MSAREEVLARIRGALGASPGSVGVPRDYRTAGTHPPGSPALLDLLADRLLDYHASVRRCTLAAVPESLSGMLGELGAGRVVAPPGLPAGWLAGWLDGTLVDDPPLDVAALDAVDAVVTGCAVAIAETGTVVLDGSPACGRRALTLVPDRHVVVVRADQVVQTVPEALARLDPRVPQTWVSGPSATSDIELNRVEGVHGPRTLAVLLASA